jgi:hypothetical protein
MAVIPAGKVVCPMDTIKTESSEVVKPLDVVTETPKKTGKTGKGNKSDKTDKPNTGDKAEKTADAVNRLNAIVAECKSAVPTGGGKSKAALRRAKREAFNTRRKDILACMAALRVNSAHVRSGKHGNYGAVHFADYKGK